MTRLEGREVPEESADRAFEIAPDHKAVDDAAWGAHDRAHSAAADTLAGRDVDRPARPVSSPRSSEPWSEGETIQLHAAELNPDTTSLPREVAEPDVTDADSGGLDLGESLTQSERLQEARESVEASYAQAEADRLPENTIGQFEADAQQIIDKAPSDTPAAKQVEFREPGPAKEVEFHHPTAADSTDTFTDTAQVEQGVASEQPERTREVHTPDEQKVVDEARAYLAELVRDGYVLGGDPVSRADQWHEQGNNDRRFENDCGVAAVAATARDCGCDVNENDAVNSAVAQGRCEVDPTNDPRDNGGTTGRDRHELLQSFGIENTIEYPQSPEQLAQYVEDGRGVITALDAYEMWDVSPFDSPTYYDADGRSGTNHAVQVTGTVRDSSGKLAGFVINDTGSPGGAGKVVPLDKWDACWTNTWKDHETLVTNQPTSVEKAGR